MFAKYYEYRYGHNCGHCKINFDCKKDGLFCDCKHRIKIINQYRKTYYFCSHTCKEWDKFYNTNHNNQ